MPCPTPRTTASRRKVATSPYPNPKKCVSPGAYSAAGPVVAVSRRLWSATEDAHLRQLCSALGRRSWAAIASHMAGRTAKQCRERWHNHLDASLSNEPISLQEERMIVELQQELGNKWALISKYLASAGYRRTDNCIKNHWNTVLRAPGALDRLLVDGELPSQFPDGVIPPEPPAAAAAPGAENDPAETSPARPLPYEAVVVRSVLAGEGRSASSLAKLVGEEGGSSGHATATASEVDGSCGSLALSAMVSMLLAQNRAQLLDATARLSLAIADATSPRGLGKASGDRWGSSPRADGVLAEIGADDGVDVDELVSQMLVA